ncbi:type III secretory pathway component EscT [Caldalkalibacillus uzonensis]|uniref:Type III secretory pathway component EscT n=1 Tax=Caldalkalibacillus uzonensis TaxID=353224 RepID=A0ABU0CW77_9BACI|nr:hypothetical protein [Caldalkalibacillus uzonensis]MDQ0340368.1 type III secretory pathway component EscT [Caldalkalibacillus uzonensis]
MHDKQTDQSKLKLLIMVILGLTVFLVPGLRRFMLTRLLRNKVMMSFALNTLLSVPFIRDRLLPSALASKSHPKLH